MLIYILSITSVENDPNVARALNSCKTTWMKEISYMCMPTACVAHCRMFV